jgi:4-amino-4-deoxy-L-arabinose transferase-like glycosyltransferase
MQNVLTLNRREWMLGGAVIAIGLLLRLLPALDHQHFCPLVDDSFYALSIARNIAQGEGITYAGSPTNGFQPLFVFLAVPFYRVFGGQDALAIHGILTLMAVIGTLTGGLLYAALRRMGARLGAMFVLIVWSLSPHFIGNGVNGLETGLAAFFMAASLLHLEACLRGRERVRWPAAAGLGILLGLGILARVDMGFWAVAVALDWLIVRNAAPFRRRVAALVVTTIVAAALCLPWFAYNVVVFGNPVPGSGAGVRFISLALGYRVWGQEGMYLPPESIPLGYYLRSLQTLLTDILNAIVTPLAILTPPGFVVLILLAAFLARRSLGHWLRRVPALLVFPACLVPAYAFWILGQWFYPRYAVTIVLALTILLGLLLQAFVARFPGARRPLFAAGAVLALTMVFLGWNSALRTCLRGEYSNGRDHHIAVDMAAAHVPPGAPLGGFQSGALEYYGRDWPVMNLDGVVNAAALESMRANRMDAYLREQGIDWLLDLDWIIEALYARHAGVKDPMAQWETVVRSGRMVLLRRKTGAL